jgi:uncharacterized protein
MTAQQLFNKYYPEGSIIRKYLYIHSTKVMEAALKVAEVNPQLQADTAIIRDAALLHDFGIIMTDAPEIGCHGRYPYIAHGYLGREILEKEGFTEIAPFCERHVGMGISLQDIISKNLPLPRRDMLPVTIEEKIVCFADKFFSKTAEDLTQPKPLDKIMKSLRKYGEDKIKRFEEMVDLFGVDYLYRQLKKS